MSFSFRLLQFKSVLVLFVLVCTGCGKTSYDNRLPDTSHLGIVRGLRTVRVISHLHSPYSYDACDKNGMPDGQVNQSCIDHIRESMCINHVDMAFLTDHPDRMASTPFSDLLLPRPGDSITSIAQNNYVNTLAGCSDGFRPQLSVGFEGRLLALGMENHLNPEEEDLAALYEDETEALRNRLDLETKALVIIPHTESRTVDLIKSIKPDGIEIYNVHANLDPKIRKTSFHKPPFQFMPAVATYLIDPYKDLVPDFAFMSFIEFSNIYFEKWNTLIYENEQGSNLTGLAGTDGHENVFPQKVADGERFDSARRIMRFISNYVLAPDRDINSIKSAIKAGRSYVVTEGLGTPMGLDYFAQLGESFTSVGGSVSLAGGAVQLKVALPSLYSESPHGSNKPSIRIELRQVLDQGVDKVVATATNEALTYQTLTPGAYRTHIYITPHHLKPFLGPFEDLTKNEYLWIISNHIILN